MALGLLAAAPSAALAPALLRGEIPLAMDPTLYFFPLKWHAGQLLASGQMPWWNRSILTGMPLFANPQAALAYPLNWLMMIKPSGFSFFFPMTLQLGLWAALTAELLRRLRIGMGAALFGGALCLLGNYGWSRFQYGNFLNVLPWWPLWLMAAHGFAASGRARWIAIGSAAGALMLLAGAHQLALYGALGLAAYSIVLMLFEERWLLRWGIFALVTLAASLLIGSPGWLPQWAFIAETNRAGSLDEARILAGTFSSIGEILRVLIGPSGDMVADAEASASVGGFALVVAGLVPRDRRRLAPWLAAWAMALVTILPTWRPAAELILRYIPGSGNFHGPRRMLGVAQWALIVAASISFSGWIEAQAGPWGRRAARAAPAAALFTALLFLIGAGPSLVWYPAALFGALGFFLRPSAGIGPMKVRPIVHAMFALAAIGGGTALGLSTWRTTPRARIDVDRLLRDESGNPPLITQAGLESPERFFALDWLRDSSYNYTRADLTDWALPNLAMLYGLEDIGGYEPARSARYDAWLAGATDWPAGRQPWAEHFGLVYPPHPSNRVRLERLAEANPKAALLPRWGLPVYRGLRPRPAYAAPTIFSAATPRWPAEMDLTVIPLIAPGREPSVLIAAIAGPTRAAYYTPAIDENPTTGSNAPIALWKFRPSEAGLEPSDALTAIEVRPTRPPAVSLPDPDTDSQLGSAAAIDIVGVYGWSEALNGLLEPSEERRAARLHRYLGPARWAELRPAPGRIEGSGEVLGFEVRANRIDLQVRWSGPSSGVLEVHDAYWPGWKARVNGEPTEIRPSGPAGAGPWRWIDVPPGRSEVILSYRPPLLGISLAMAAGGLLLAALATALAARRAKAGLAAQG